LGRGGARAERRTARARADRRARAVPRAASARGPRARPLLARAARVARRSRTPHDRRRSADRRRFTYYRPARGARRRMRTSSFAVAGTQSFERSRSMFSGIVKGIGEVLAVDERGGDRLLVIGIARTGLRP